MQVFIVGSPLETAEALDDRRLNRQIQETKVILDALNGAKAWSNHPCTLQYRGYEAWLVRYMSCLHWHKLGYYEEAKKDNERCKELTPPFHTQEYFDQMKRRLFEKDEGHYKQWSHLGKSNINWYWSPSKGKFIKYRNGKRI